MDYKLKESDLIGTLEGYPLEIAQLYYDTTVKSGKTKNVLQSIQEEPSFGFHWGSDENGMKGINWSGIRYHKRFESYYKVFPKIEENTERYQEGTIVYPTREGFKTYSSQIGNSKHGRVCEKTIKNYNGIIWVIVEWSGGHINSYVIDRDITHDITKSVFKGSDKPEAIAEPTVSVDYMSKYVSGIDPFSKDENSSEIIQPVIKRTQKKKRVEMKVSKEINVCGFREKTKTNK